MLVIAIKICIYRLLNTCNHSFALFLTIIEVPLNCLNYYAQPYGESQNLKLSHRQRLKE